MELNLEQYRIVTLPDSENKVSGTSLFNTYFFIF